ncbi:hypothetical protein [Streptomyces sp. NPDC127098]|uniref:hypothetical protein n=1 Tax=Streptomyces sp. NPDC127098 TaxID=3347137 RepID=UPI0036490A99
MSTDQTETVPADWWDRLYDGSADTAAPPVTEKDQVSAPGDDVDEDVDQDLDEDQDDDQVDEDEDQDDGDESGDRPKKKRRSARLARPKQSAADWYADLSAPSRHLLYNGSAAGAGCFTGLVSAVHGWIEDCGDDYSIGAALSLGVMVIAAAAVVVDMRSRGWWPPLAWIGRIPLASCVLALGLYAPAASL